MRQLKRATQGTTQPARETVLPETAQDEKGDFNGLGRIAEASIPEEPGVGKPHAGIYAGAVG